MSVYTDNNDQLRCPLCGDEFVHIDQVRVAARPKGEDGPEVHVGLTASGTIVTADAPMGRLGSGRRHRIALIGYCECCGGEFALVFTQHKGVTFTESVRTRERAEEMEDQPANVTPSQRFTSPDTDSRLPWDVK